MEEKNNRREGDKQQGGARREGGRPRTRTQRDKGRPVEYDDNQQQTIYHAGGGNTDRPRRKFNNNKNNNDRPFNNNGGRPEGKNAGRPAGKGKRPAGRKGPNGKIKKIQQKSYFKGHLAPEFTEEELAQQKKPTYASKGLVRLNKYIANAGICSRRDADRLIEAGSVTVNGQVITQMGYLVRETDVVNYGGETLRSEPKRYFLLNKPKGYITTLDDPQERQTVMELIQGACKERIYPVGRLDRNTTGLLLFTNDGEMAKKLTHPSTGVYKVYKVELDRAVSVEDMQHMLEGIELEDGLIKVDDIAYDVSSTDHHAIDKRIVGVQLHSGKNRIVRRIFESQGFTVHKLDRTVFAGLTKKDLPRGRYRELNDREINFLKMI